MVTAQVIPVGVFGPLVGRLGDIYGRRYFVMAGNMFGLIGCVMGATAQPVNVAIGGGILLELLRHVNSLLGQASVKWPQKIQIGCFGDFRIVLCAARCIRSYHGSVELGLLHRNRKELIWSLGNAVAARASWR
jgi:MFS family permease